MELENHQRWVPGYENKYFATFQGEIFRLYKNGKIRQITGYKAGNGYRVKLTIDDVSKEYRFNRIIWETFKGPIPDGYFVVRKTNIGTNNHIANLTLRTKSQHGKKTGPTSRSKEVVLLDDGNHIIDHWSSARKAAKDLFVSYQTVMNICNGKTKRKPIVNVRWSKGNDLDHPRLPGEFMRNIKGECLC